MPIPWTILTQHPVQSSTGGRVVQLKGSLQRGSEFELHSKHFTLLPAVINNLNNYDKKTCLQGTGYNSQRVDKVLAKSKRQF